MTSSSTSSTIGSGACVHQQVILAGKLDEARARDVLGEEPAFLDVGVAVVGAVHDERRHPDRGQDVAHVDRRVHLEQGERRAGARAAPEVAREASRAAAVEARGDVGDVHPADQFRST